MIDPEISQFLHAKRHFENSLGTRLCISSTEDTSRQSPVYNARNFVAFNQNVETAQIATSEYGSGPFSTMQFDQFVNSRRVFARLRLDATSKILVEIVDIVE